MHQVRPSPCASCPYRLDVPPGVWDQSEYEKLRKFDPPATAPDGRPWREGFEPNMSYDEAIFFCHQQDETLCAGWVGCHGPENLLGVIIGVVNGRIDPAIYNYETNVPLHESGHAAARHGIANVDAAAQEVIDKITHKRDVTRTKGS